MLKTLRLGGVHPHDHKISRNESIRIFDVPATVTIPLGQHIGAPAKPVVKAGDHVKKGQKIADAAEGLSVAIHCSIDGVVEKVSEKEITVRES